jgi:hypothetical protein
MLCFLECKFRKKGALGDGCVYSEPQDQHPLPVFIYIFEVITAVKAFRWRPFRVTCHGISPGNGKELLEGDRMSHHGPM